MNYLLHGLQKSLIRINLAIQSQKMLVQTGLFSLEMKMIKTLAGYRVYLSIYLSVKGFSNTKAEFIQNTENPSFLVRLAGRLLLQFLARIRNLLK